MNGPIWNSFLTERDKKVCGNAGYGARQGFGKRQTVLIIGVNYNFCGTAPKPSSSRSSAGDCHRCFSWLHMSIMMAG